MLCPRLTAGDSVGPGPMGRLEERLNGIKEVAGSSPTGSTGLFRDLMGIEFFR